MIVLMQEGNSHSGCRDIGGERPWFSLCLAGVYQWPWRLPAVYVLLLTS